MGPCHLLLHLTVSPCLMYRPAARVVNPLLSSSIGVLCCDCLEKVDRQRRLVLPLFVLVVMLRVTGLPIEEQNSCT